MSTRRYTQEYKQPSQASWYSAAPVDGANDSGLADAVANTYAFTRRNNLCYTLNTSGNAISLSSAQHGGSVEFIRVPIGYRFVRGDVKVLIYYDLTGDGSGQNKVFAECVLGNQSAQIELTSASYAWASATLTANDETFSVAAQFWGRPWLDISLSCYGQNTVTIRSVCVYQPAAVAAPAWADISGANNRIGVDDWPASAAQYKFLTDAVYCVRENRTKRSNVFAHWYGAYNKTGNSYSSGSAALGLYKFVKREGVSDIVVHMMAQTKTPPQTVFLHAAITGSAGSDSAASVSYTSGTNPDWESITFTMAGADVTNELELTLKLDARDNGTGTEIYMPGVCVTEKLVSASSVAHTVCSVGSVDHGSLVQSGNYDKLKDTLVHLWKRGQSIALCDYRFSAASNSYTEAVACKGTSRDKTDYMPSATSVIGHCLVYPSESSKRLYIRAGFQTNAGSTYNKHIEVQISNSFASATFTEVGPGGSGRFTFSDDYSDRQRVIQGYVDIPAAAINTPAAELSPGDNPYQVWVFGFTNNATEWIIPQWVAIEEEFLHVDEFP